MDDTTTAKETIIVTKYTSEMEYKEVTALAAEIEKATGVSCLEQLAKIVYERNFELQAEDCAAKTGGDMQVVRSGHLLTQDTIGLVLNLAREKPTRTHRNIAGVVGISESVVGRICRENKVYHATPRKKKT
jgi:hypothetical protein